MSDAQFHIEQFPDISPPFEPHATVLRHEVSQIPMNEGVKLYDLPDSSLKTALVQERHDRISTVAQNTDVIVKKNKQLEHAQIDAVTGLPNRQVFEREVNETVQRAAGDPIPDVAIVIIDLKGLKRVNDGISMIEGDTYLRTVAGATAETLRPDDRMSRIGGDELGIILRGVKTDDEHDEATVLGAIGDRISAAVDGVLTYAPELYTGIYFGGHILRHGETPLEAMQAAAAALNADKAAFHAALPQHIIDQDPRNIK